MKRLLFCMMASIAIIACTDDGGVDNSGGSQSPSITLSAASLSVDSDNSEATISFTSTTAWSAEVTEGSDWCTINPTNGAAGSAKIAVTAVANESYEGRSATIVIKAGEVEKSVTIEQMGKDISELLEKEREALIAFYNATGGDNWTRNDNWSSDKPVSEWYNVDTDSEGRVVKLSFVLNNLTGYIPKEIGTLTKLRTLKILSNPKLSGEIPKELGNCKELEYLYIEETGITGVIPEEIYDCTKLKVLTFTSNKLYGKISSKIGNLTNLYTLSVKRNNMNGAIPAEIGTCHLWSVCICRLIILLELYLRR